MVYSALHFNVSDDVATITLNRPDVLNGLNSQMRAEIPDAVNEAAQIARALVITGAGRGFCSGQDLGSAHDVSKIDLEGTLIDEYEPMLRSIVDCPIPTIAAVNGPAAGAGANLALVADIVIAQENAYFLEAFALIGLVPDAAGSYFMPRNMGFARAMGASLLAERITARQAADWGLIWEAVPEAEFDARVAARARQLAQGPSEAYRRIKRLIRASFDNDLDAQLALEAREQGRAGRTRDFAEGVLAFNEKRTPRFEGR
ncbi:MAG: enoyl-CoA hydratase-related protein [Paracoccaceae bacterium]